MSELTIKDRVIVKLEAQCKKGLEIYGETVDRDDMTRLQWLEHAQEEALDMCVYLEKLIQIEKSKHERP